MNNFILTIIFCLGMYLAEAQIPEDDHLEVVADFGENMAIGVSVSSENRDFVSFPGHGGSGHLALADVKEGELGAYPNERWNEIGDYEIEFIRVNVLQVKNDD